MIPTDDLEDRIRRLRVVTTVATDRRILADASAALQNRPSERLDVSSSSVWRMIIKSKWTRLAAALLMAVTLGTITFHHRADAVAYALEQTLEANSGLRYIHIRVESAGRGMRETWAQFSEDGKLQRLRMSAPKTDDGAKEVVWQEGKAEVWFKTKGHVLVIRNNEMAEKVAKELVAFDPRKIMEQLHDAQAKKKVFIETQEPSAKGDPITLVVS